MSACVSVNAVLRSKKISILPFNKVKSQIDQLQKDYLGKYFESTLVSDLSLLAQTWWIIAAVFATHC